SGGAYRETCLPNMGRWSRRRKGSLGLLAVAHLLEVRDNVVDQAVFLRFLGRHETVAFHVLFDLLDGLAGVLGVQFVELAPQVQNLARLNLDVRGGALRAAR